MATVPTKRPAEVTATAAGGALGVIAVWVLHQALSAWAWTPEIDAAIASVVTFLAGPIWARVKGWIGLA